MASTNAGGSKPRMKVQVAAPQANVSTAPKKEEPKPAAKPRTQVKARLAVDAPSAAPAPKSTPTKAKPAARPAIKVSQPASSSSTSSPTGSASTATPAIKPTVRPSVTPKAAPKVTAAATPTATPKAAPRIAATPTAFVNDEEPYVQEQASEPRVQQPVAAPRPEPESASAQQPAAEPRKSFSFTAWVDTTFGKNKYAFYGGLIALLVALLIFAIGFWRVFFISLLVLVGVAIGQIVDGDPRIIRTIRNLFPSDDGDE